jgi:hypothetical protein
VLVLLSYYPKVARGFRQDYFVTQLVRGLESAERAEKARQILRQHLEVDRPSQNPLFADLGQIAESIEERRCEATRATCRGRTTAGKTSGEIAIR